MTERPEVLELTIAPGLRCGSTLANSACLTAMSSFTTSTTQSHSAMRARSSSRLPTSMRSRAAAVKSGAGRSFFRLASPASANLFRKDFLLLSSPGPASGGTMSSIRTGIPALATWAAMPLPMTPEPRTATFRMRLIGVSPAYADALCRAHPMRLTR